MAARGPPGADPHLVRALDRDRRRTARGDDEPALTLRRSLLLALAATLLAGPADAQQRRARRPSPPPAAPPPAPPPLSQRRAPCSASNPGTIGSSSNGRFWCAISRRWPRRATVSTIGSSARRRWARRLSRS